MIKLAKREPRPHAVFMGFNGGNALTALAPQLEFKKLQNESAFIKSMKPFKLEGILNLPDTILFMNEMVSRVQPKRSSAALAL